MEGFWSWGGWAAVGVLGWVVAAYLWRLARRWETLAMGWRDAALMERAESTPTDDV